MFHKRDILSAVTMVAGLSGLFGNSAFTGLLDKALPAPQAGAIVTWGSLIAILAGWVVGRLTPAPSEVATPGQPVADQPVVKGS